ncbi:hybrid sensor histidine kinase/response regulator [Chitinivibrio alkaliphilus]|uniref:histidine kinase n=1 Tax=Chitinivibrio alkaliphilus ACht1 TaxID=1313304 RepID=U7D871_9BACT|nr:PAS domain-containing sensor histidine kinase [Chitinivibrio alkaliphilus]ERP32138.1 PAS/PAC sensor hybrid histidine kinase [Chitinivibrio alkaliphilus ACht1]
MSNASDKLRKKAKELLQKKKEDISPHISTDITDLAEELSIHQIELEHQNEALRTTQQELEETSEKYRTLFHKAPAAYLTVDFDYTIRDANSEAVRILGKTKEDITYTPLSACIHEADRDTLYHHIRDTLRESSITECELRTNESSPRTLLVRSTTHGPREILTLLFDISQRKKAERKLSLLFERTATPTSIVNRSHGHILLQNPAWEKHDAFADYTTGPHSISTIFADPKQNIEKSIRHAEKNTEIHDVLLRDTSQNAFYKLIIIPIDKNSVYLFAIETTESKRKMQLQKMDSVSKMAGGIAHDFNNILCSIKSAADLIRLMDITHEDFPELFDIIQKGIENSIAMTEELLDISHNRITERSELDIHSVLSEAVLFNSFDTRIVLTEKYEATSHRVYGNHTALFNSFSNLIINAQRAILHSGHIEVQTRTVELDESFSEIPGQSVSPGQYIEIDVRDTGCGIKKEHLDKIFDPFFSHSHSTKGKGLGLTRCFSIVRKHMGTMTVQSVEEEGTVFHLYLPLMEEPKTTQRQLSSSNTVEDSIDLTQKKILVVDDEASIVMVLKHMLTKMGCNVTTTQDAREALEIFKNQGDFNLVILDMIMPKMSGEECFTHLRNHRADIPILIHSGYYDTERISSLLKLERTGFIKKPASHNILQNEIVTLLSSKEQQ